LEDLLSDYPQLDYAIIRHPLNIGGNANIVRCFEVCESPWLWVLGDDDRVDSAAISTIFAEIAARPTLVYANFSTQGHQRSKSFVTKGQEQFAASIDHFMHAILISTCIYNHAKVKARINYGYQFAYSCAPHLLMVLLSLADDGECIFSDRTIVHWEVAEDEQRWPMITPWLGFPTLLEAPIPHPVRLHLARAISKSTSPRVLARELYYTARQNGDFDKARHLFDSVMFRATSLDRRLLMRLKIALMRWILVAPRVFAIFDAFRLRLSGRQMGINRAPQRVE
jgi:hypothetical protein